MKPNFTIFTLFLSAFFFFGCPATKDLPPKEETSTTEDIPNKIMVLLEGRTAPTQLLEAFAEYKLTSNGPSSRTENRYLLTFDPTLIKAADMMAKIKSFPGVVEAKFAQQLKN